MAKTFSEEDLKLLGYTDAVIKPIEDGAPWRIYEAIEDSLGAGATVDNFLYFPSSITKDHIKICAKNRSYDGYYFLAPPSAVNDVKKHFPNIKTIDELIQPRLKKRFSNYTKDVKKDIDARHTPNDIYILSTLHSTLLQCLNPTNSKGSKKPIHIITADAATGKTTLVRNIVSEMIDKKGFITIYLEIAQIESLDSYSDFWELIKSQLGSVFLNESLFKHGLKQGYFIFIFDGFDELCTKRDSHFTANKLLEWFVAIVASQDSECKIAITTRKSFWQSEINTSPLDKYIEIYELEPFDRSQVNKYFKKFFKDDNAPTNTNRANSIYGQLLTNNLGDEIPFIKLPSSVDLIADSVKNGVKNVDQLTNTKPAITQFLLFMLNRENARYKLLTTPESQLSAFEDIAISYLNETFEIDDLLVGFDEGEDKESLKHHPFICNDYSVGKYKFRFVLLELYFISVYLQSKFKEYIDNRTEIKNTALKIIKSEVKGEGALLDMFIDLLDKNFNFKAAHENASNETKSFLFHVAKRQIKGRINEKDTISFFSDLADAKAKTQTTTNLITGLYIVGDIVDMDFSNTILQECTFKNINFKKCRGKNTKFKNCKFIGDLEFDNHDGSSGNPMKQFMKNWCDIKEENCEFDTLSEYAWNNLPNITSTLSIAKKKETVEKTFKAILDKFFYRGHINDISRNKFQDGVLGKSIYTEDIIEIMQKDKFITITQEPTGRGFLYKINKSKSGCMYKFNEENSITGDLKMLYKKIIKII